MCVSHVCYSLGDPTASAVGILSGGALKVGWTGKSFLGTLANFAVSYVITFTFLNQLYIPTVGLEV